MPLTQSQINDFTRRARLAGMDENSIQAEIARKFKEMGGGDTGSFDTAGKAYTGKTAVASDGGFTSNFVSSLVDPSTSLQESDKSIGGFIGNIGSSLVKNVGDIASAAINVLNPNLEENTIANIAKLGIDVVKLAGGDKSEENKARQVVEFYKKRYGEDLGTTLYEDPVGVLLDISTVLGGAGAVVKGVGEAGKLSTVAKVGKTLETAGAMADPLATTTKLAGAGLKYTKIADKVAEATDGIRTSIAEEAARRSLRANPTQMQRFQDIIGSKDAPGDIGQWMTKNKIYTKEDVVAKIDKLQKKYNQMVRNGEKVDPAGYIQKLRDEANKILESDLSEEAKNVADDLNSRADWMEKRTAVKDEAGNITGYRPVNIDVITNTKSSQFTKVPKNAMVDATKANGGKIAGELGIAYLDELAPGSGVVGKKLQELRAFDEIVSKQRNLGKGSLLINIFKPAMSGVMGGYILGGGVPGGNIPGAVIGGTMAGLAANPYVQRSMAKMMLEGVDIPPEVMAKAGKAGSDLYATSKAGRMTEAPGNSGELSKTDQTIKDNNNSSLGGGTQQLPGLEGNGGAYNNIVSPEQIVKSRKEAVQGLLMQGVNDPQTQLELLNYDEAGNKVGDFTLSEVLDYNQPDKTPEKSLAPSKLNPFGGMTKRQVLALALSSGAKKSDLEDLGKVYDMFADEGGTLSKENMQIADGLRTEYFTRTKENGFLTANQAYQKIIGTEDSAAGDLSLIYGYMKLLDPNSVVRESEADMAQNAGSFGDRVVSAMNRIKNGQRLTKEQRADFRKTAEQTFRVYQSKQANIDAFYQSYASRLGIDPKLIAIGLYQ